MLKILSVLLPSLCELGFHDGDVQEAGRVIVTQKKNRPEVPLPGIYLIRRCRHCGEPFARHTDRVVES